MVLKVVYNSPTTIHVFVSPADDLPLFPSILPIHPPTIRTQIDLQGWSIEALSSTTTLVTLLDGTSIDTVRYDHDRGNFRIEYSVCPSRQTTTTSTLTFTSSITSAEAKAQEEEENSTTLIVECELRCDLDTWGSALDIVVDPPPRALSCLQGRRLGVAGGGVWITITHDAVLAGDERLQAIVRRGITNLIKDRGLVVVNGVKVEVNAEELSEVELKVKRLTKQKRIKPLRVPLDQPPVIRIKRRKQFDDNNGDSNGPESSVESTPDTASSLLSPLSAAPMIPKFSSPLSRFFTMGSPSATRENPASLSSPAVSANEVTVSEAETLIAAGVHIIYANEPTDGQPGSRLLVRFETLLTDIAASGHFPVTQMRKCSSGERGNGRNRSRTSISPPSPSSVAAVNHFEPDRTSPRPHPTRVVITPTFERVPTNGGDYSEWEETTRITTETTLKRNEGGYWERVKGAFSRSASQNSRWSRTNSMGGRPLHDGIRPRRTPRPSHLLPFPQTKLHHRHQSHPCNTFSTPYRLSPTAIDGALRGLQTWYPAESLRAVFEKLEPPWSALWNQPIVQEQVSLIATPSPKATSDSPTEEISHPSTPDIL